MDLVYDQILAEAAARHDTADASPPRHEPEVYAKVIMIWLERWAPGVHCDTALRRARHERPAEFVTLHDTYLDAHAAERRATMH